MEDGDHTPGARARRGEDVIPGEQQQLRDTLDRWLQHDQPEDRLEDVRVEARLLRARRPRGEDTAPPTAFTPVAVRGQPVSETLIEERR